MADGTTSCKTSEWILQGQTFSTDRGPDPSDPELERSRAHYTLTRYRYLKAPYLYDAPIGDVETGTGLYHTTGVYRANIGGSLSYTCTASDLTSLGEGVDHVRETQVWEYLGSWSAF